MNINVPLIAPHLAAQPSGTLDARVQGLIAQRAELFELVAPVRRAALANMHRSARMRKSQASMASRLRRQVATTFDTELSQLDDDLRAETLEILDLYLSWDTWERLRRWQRLSGGQIEGPGPRSRQRGPSLHRLDRGRPAPVP